MWTVNDKIRLVARLIGFLSCTSQEEYEAKYILPRTVQNTIQIRLQLNGEEITRV